MVLHSGSVFGRTLGMSPEEGVPHFVTLHVFWDKKESMGRCSIKWLIAIAWENMDRSRRYQEPRDERITLRVMGWCGHLIVIDNWMEEKGRK